MHKCQLSVTRGGEEVQHTVNIGMHEKWAKYVFFDRHEKRTWSSTCSQKSDSEIAKSECGGCAGGSKCVFTFNFWPNLNHNSHQEGFHCRGSFHFQSKFKLVWLHQVSLLFLSHWVVYLVWLAETPAKLVFLQKHENSCSDLSSLIFKPRCFVSTWLESLYSLVQTIHALKWK